MPKSLKSILLLTIVALIAVLVIPAAAQDGGRTPALQAVRDGGPLVVNPEPHAMGALLYDQTAGQNGYGGLDLYATETGDGFHLAADFEVPAGYVWAVDGIVLPGFWYFDDPTTVTDFTVEFYTDDSGPDAVACTATIDSFASTLTEMEAEFSTAPCELEEGTYWVTAYPHFDSTGGFFFLWYIWYWANVTPDVGEPAYFMDVNDYFGTGCTEWTAAGTCGFTYTDMAFALYGTESEAEPEPEPEPEVPAVNYPNNGEIMISSVAPVYTYGAAGDYMTNIVLPKDYDGNGYDTYVVTATAEVAGEMWYAIWVGGPAYLWVPGSQVIVIR